jgi:hypothetical protein
MEKELVVSKTYHELSAVSFSKEYAQEYSSVMTGSLPADSLDGDSWSMHAVRLPPIFG